MFPLRWCQSHARDVWKTIARFWYSVRARDRRWSFIQVDSLCRRRSTCCDNLRTWFGWRFAGFLLAMQNPVAVRTKPFCRSICYQFFRDPWLVAALVPALVASIAENDHVPWRAITSQTMLTEGKLLSSSINLGLDLGVLLDGRARDYLR